jgi:hypothetical protein
MGRAFDSLSKRIRIQESEFSQGFAFGSSIDKKTTHSDLLLTPDS